MNLKLLLASPMLQYYVECLGWVLVHSLWQLSIVSLTAGVLLHCLRRSSSAIRHGVLVAAMSLSVALPAIKAALQPAMPAAAMSKDMAKEVKSNTATELGTRDLESPQTLNMPENDYGEAPVMHTKEPNDDLVLSPERVLASNGVALAWWDLAATLLRPWLAWIVAAWALGVVLCSLRPLLGWYMLSRLRRVGIAPPSEEVFAALRRVSKRLGVRTAVRVLQSTLAQVPIVAGYVRPVILLPVSLATSLPISQLEAILAHELAHVRRHDFVVNLLQMLFETTFFYHPAAWWLSRQIRIEREHCCDDFVVALLGDKVEYGRALVAVESLRGNRAVLALSAADGSLLARVRRLAGRNTGRAASSPWSAFVLIACCLGALWGMSVFSWPGLAKPPEKAKEDPTASIQPLLGPSPDRDKGQRMELVAWSPDSRQIYTTSTFQNLVRWDLKGETLTPRMVRVPHFAKSMVVSQKSGLVVIGTNEGVVQLWDGFSLEEHSQIRFSPKFSTFPAAISRDETLLAGWCSDGTVDVYEIESEKRLCRLGDGKSRGMSSLAFSADAAKLATLDQGQLTLWTVPQGAKLAEWKFPSFAAHSTIHWSPDGETLAAVSDGQVALVKAKEGSIPRIVYAPDEIVMVAPNLRGIERNGVRRGDVPDNMIAAGVMSISPDFKTVASAALDGSIAIWDIETRKIVSKLAAPPGGREEKYPGLYRRHLSFSPNGRTLACTREFEGDVVVWVLAPPDETVPAPAKGAFKKRAREILQTPDDAEPLPDIRLTGDEVSPAGIDQLASKNWDTVTLVDAKFNGEIIERLRRAASIRTLRLFGTGLSGQIPRLDHVRGLVGLEIDAPLTGRDLEAIGQLAELQRLSLPQEITINVSGAREIARLVKLKSLRLYNVNIDDTSFVELRTLVGLDELDLTHTRITDAGLATIERMPHLKTLELYRHPDWFTKEQLTDACLASVGRLVELDRLSLSGKIGNDGLKQVARLPKLKSLMILGTEINGEGLSALADSKVETLALGAEQLGPFAYGIEASTTLEQVPGLVNLKKCRTLKHIIVNGKFIGAASDVWPRLLPTIAWSFNS